MPKAIQEIVLPPAARGVIQNIPSYLLPPDALANAENVWINQEGRQVVRPGFSALGSGNEPGARIMGAIQYTSNDAATRLVTVSTNGMWQYDAGASEWTNITGITLAGANDDQVSFASFASAGNVNLITVNDNDVPQTHDGTTSAAANLAGSPPIARSVCIAANRVIFGNVVESGVRAVNRVRWSDINDHETWDAANIADLRGTDDFIITVETLNRTAFAVHKSQSQWIGVAQDSQFPFRFELVDTKPGPISTNSVVRIQGVHFYLGSDASVYMFDGIRATELGQAIKPWLRDNLDWQTRKRAFGYYHRGLRQIHWIFPAQDDQANDRGLALDPATRAFWPIQFTGEMSAGTEYDDDTTAAVSQYAILGGTDGTAYLLSETYTNDNGTAISAFWEHSPRPYAGFNAYTRSISIDTFFAKASASTNVDVSLAGTDTLADTLSFSVIDTEDISVDQRHRIDPASVYNRFIAIKHDVDANNASVAWLGSIVYFDRQGID